MIKIASEADWNWPLITKGERFLRGGHEVKFIAKRLRYNTLSSAHHFPDRLLFGCQSFQSLRFQTSPLQIEATHQ